MKEYLIDFLEECGIGTIESKNIPEGFAEEIEELVQRKPFANSNMITEIIKMKYQNRLTYREIGLHCQMPEFQVHQMLKKTISKLNSYFVNENFIHLLAKYCIKVSKSLTADLLKEYLEKQNRYIQYQGNKIAELNISEKTYCVLYQAGYTNMKELLSEDLLFFRRYLSDKKYYELLCAISEFLHKYHHDTETISLRNILLADYPNNLLMYHGIRNISGTFSEEAVHQIEKIMLRYFRKKGSDKKNAERNIMILKQRYQQRMTLAEIGKYNSICRERVNQILQNARQCEVIYNNDLLSVLYNEMQNGRITISDAMTEKCFFDMNARKQESAELIVCTDLSVSSKNLLVRSGYKTVEDVIRSGAERILNIHGVGKAHFAEIADTMIKYGANPEEWKY